MAQNPKKRVLHYGQVSEWVLRNAAAWALRETSLYFLVVQTDDGYELHLEGEADEAVIRLIARYVNEFRLRELIDSKTGALREKVALSALSLVYKDLNKNDPG